MANSSMLTSWSEDITFRGVFGWSAASPFELSLSLCECWGSSRTHWGQSHSSSRPSWSLTSQTLNTWKRFFFSYQNVLAVNPGVIAQTYLAIRGTALEVSGTFLAMRNRKTVWPRRVAMDIVHFWPPAAEWKANWDDSTQSYSIYLSRS